MDPIIQRRKAVADRHDAALERWPDREGKEFTKELQAVVRDLADLGIRSDAEGGDPAERSVTWCYLGDAYFDLARGKDVSLLQKGAAAYAHAERLLAHAHDPMRTAKLNFNYANTLRGLSEGFDLTLLEEAKTRYARALDWFGRNAPQYTAQVEQTLRSLEPQIALARTYQQAKQGYDTLERIISVLKESDLPESKRKEVASEMYKAFRQEQSQIPDLIDQAHEAITAVQGKFQDTQDADVLLENMSKLDAIARSASSPSDRVSGLDGLADMLEVVYERQVKERNISSARQHAIKGRLMELRKVMADPEDSPEQNLAKASKFRKIAASMVELIKSPSLIDPPPASGSRAERLEQFISGLKTFLSRELLRPNKSRGDSQAAQKLLSDLVRAQEQVRKLFKDERQLRELERDTLRPQASEIQAHALRHHVTLATPLTSSAEPIVSANSVFHAGDTYSRGLVQQVVKAGNFEFSDEVPSRSVAAYRFEKLRSCGVAVFNLMVEKGRPLAEVCYELGMARALGKPVVVMSSDDAPVPFDVDVYPVDLTQSLSPERSLAEAIDRAIYTEPQAEIGSSLSATIDEAERLLGGKKENREIQFILDELKKSPSDPIAAQAMLGQLLSYADRPAPTLVYPAWPGGYPKKSLRNLFHVMPFGASWSDEIRDAAEKGCSMAGAQYKRGDMATDPEIILSIWNDICHASHVLVDLTAFNANVAFEMGIAHTLGRNTMIVAQEGTEGSLGSGVFSKLRVIPYRLADGLTHFIKVISEFVTENSNS